jgi:hypothetical protein
LLRKRTSDLVWLDRTLADFFISEKAMRGHFSKLESQVIVLQRRLSAIADKASCLHAQISELNRLRDRFRKAQLSARRPRRTGRRKRTRA